MKYIVAIEPPSKECAQYGAIVPDLPGCYSMGKTVDDALNSSREAIEYWLEVAFDNNETLPKARSIEEIRKENPQWKDWIWTLVDVDLSSFSDKVERVNITITRRVLRRLDEQAKLAGTSRSGQIANLVMSAKVP